LGRRLEELKGISTLDFRTAAHSLALDRGLGPSGTYETAILGFRFPDLRHVAKLFAECDEDGTTRFLWIELCEDHLSMLDQASVFPPVAAEAQRRDSGEVGQDEPKSNSTSAKNLTWQDAAERMTRLRAQGDPWTSQRKIAEQIGCSTTTV